MAMPYKLTISTGAFGQSAATFSRYWICQECDARIDWSYADLADHGTPVCLECDIEMELCL